MVSHNGSAYLPRVLKAIQAQSRAVDRLIAVDSGSSDQSAAILKEALGGANVVQLGGRNTESRAGFGAAVRTGLAELAKVGESPETEFLWLLHDDSAPAPQALGELLRAVERAPSVTIAGCKQLDWDDERSLIDVGLSTSRWGERLTMIELDEQDQGQYDGRTDMFAVNSAGMLVRRDVWQQLGGFDPALPGTGDDVDLCWRNRLAGHRVVVVPSARMSHLRDRPGSLNTAQVARKAEVHLRLKHASWWQLPFFWIGALLGGFWQLLAGILFKDPGHGLRQLLATVAALFRPGAVFRGRSAANRSRRVSRKVIRGLQVSGPDVRSYRRALLESLTETGQDAEDEPLDSAEYVPSGDAQDDFAALSSSRRLWVGSGAVLAVVLLGLVSVVALFRFIGAEALTGGALLPLSSKLSDIWQHATSWWVGLGAGWPGHGEPFDLVLWVLGVLGLGNGSAAVTWLVLLALPLAGLGAWFCAGALSKSRWPRLLAALIWAGAPVLLISLGQGRLGTLIAHLMIPWVFLGFIRAMGAAHRRSAADPASTAALPIGKPGANNTAVRVSWTATAAAGLGLAVLTASAPILLPFAVVMVIFLMVFGGRRARTLWWTLLPSLVLFGPFVASVLDRPRALLADPGLPLAFNNAPSWQQLLGQPILLGSDATVAGASWLPSGFPWAWLAALLIGAPLVLLALAALVWPKRRPATVRVLWLVAVLAIVLGYAVSMIGTALGANDLVTPFSGPAVSVLVFALLGAAMIGLDGVQSWRSAGSSEGKGRGLPRTVAGVLTVLLLISPVLSLSMWLSQNLSGGTAVQTAADRSLPATATDRGLGQDQSRTLVITVGSEGQFSASLMRGGGTTLDALSSIAESQGISGLPGAESISSGDSVDAQLRSAVAAIVAGTGVNPLPQLNGLGVGFVVLRQGDTSAELLASQIDAVPGLATVGPTDQGWLWRVTPEVKTNDSVANASDTVGRVRIEDGKGATVGYLPSELESVGTQLSTGQDGRLLVLAERADPGWTAWLDGQKLNSVTGPSGSEWAQAFQLPAGGGHLEVRYQQPWAPWWIVAQIVVLGLTALLAIPMPAGRGRISRVSRARGASVAPEKRVAAKVTDSGGAAESDSSNRDGDGQ
ncbi:GT2 family glycosyltransferase [Psychromicrobium silvestre]|uniref:GT2 family glycosyltransferase n=1 Tax=Psychromicrobium silvestre TaxID=1645614 RepID=A0A7Y9LVU2_9MICC|nr:GT2 family glycosyltransferase [Psychromicrobium silvestre]